jgi:hypothetical protein
VEQELKEIIRNETLYPDELPSISQSNLFSSASSSVTATTLSTGKVPSAID